MERFKAKRIFITGAGSGLGRALSLEFARNGWMVASSDINVLRVGETFDLIKHAGGTCIEIKCDVTKYDEIKKAASIIKSKWGGVDIIVNNAGVPMYGDMEDIPVERWKWIMDINMMGVIYGCKAFIPLMLEQGYGHIVNIASYLGFVPGPGTSGYNVTKAGVISLSETLRIELVKKKIGISVVTPSFFKSDLIDRIYITDEKYKKMANAVFGMTSFTSENIARYIYKGVMKNRFYIIPQWDARLMWRVKRLCPELYLKLMMSVHKRGLIEKYFGVNYQ